MADTVEDYLKGFEVQKWHTTDEGFVIETVQDVDHILKSNEEMYKANSLESKYIHKDTALGMHVATIPKVFIHQWMKEFQKERGLPLPPRLVDPEFKTYMFAKASDPEWRKLRVDGRTYRLGKQNG